MAKFIYVDLTVACKVLKSEILWDNQNPYTIEVIRKDYDPSWTVPIYTKHPRDANGNTAYSVAPACPVSAVTFWII